MIIIDDKIISEDIKDQYFTCDLAKCKGACCVEGDSGAPLDFDELDILEDEKLLAKVFPYLTTEGKKSIEEKGPFYLDEEDGVMKVVLKEDKACAFVNYKNGIAYCGIEKAWLDKKIDFRKPVSCHLYPIRIKKNEHFEAVNYEEWNICRPACEKGKETKLAVYKFAKQALIRKYGEEFYAQLEATITHLNNSK